MASTAPIPIERADIHKSCKALEAIVSVLAAYTEAANALTIVQKKLAKTLKEAAGVKGTNSVPANAMISTAGIFESLAEVDVKFSKIADKEAENAGNDLRKWFKKLSKEEKAHDERLSNANARIKQAGEIYERKAKRKDRDAVDEHSRYVALLNTVGPEMSKDKYNHALVVTQRHTTVLSGLAAGLSRLAEAEWVRACEQVRKSAPSIGTIGEWRVLCEGGWTNSMPGDLPELGTNAGIDVDKTHAGPMAPIPSRPIAAGADIGPAVNKVEYPESPTSSSNSKPPHSIRKSSEGQSGVEQSITHPPASSPLSPPQTRDINKNESFVTEPDDSVLTSLSGHKEDNVDSSNFTVSSPNSSLATTDAAKSHDSSVSADSTIPMDNFEAVPKDQRHKRIEDPVSDPDHSIISESQATTLSLSQSASGPELIPSESNVIEATKKPTDDTVSERELGTQVYISSENPRPPESEGNAHIGRGLDRRLSVESRNSLVTAMRERYDTRPTKPSSPPPRDLPRLSQRVSDLAIRYTPVEMPNSSPRSGGIATVQSGLSADRFPTFQHKYRRPGRDQEQFKSSSVSPTPERDGFDDDRGQGRYRYAETSPVDRNQPFRDARGRLLPRPRSPDQEYFDELGVLDRRQLRFDSTKELSFQQREAHLREQERLLELERAMIANAREGGYASDTGRSHRGTYERLRRSESPGPMTSQQSLRPDNSSPYERPRGSETRSPLTSQQSLHPYDKSSPYERLRHSESPTTMTSQQLLRPYDHSPNCGCQRCSAQHYASTTSLSRSGRDSAMEQPVYKPEPPITLRPEKPKGWLRRLSMPLVPSNDKNLSVPSVARHGGRISPEEAGQRSFDFEHFDRQQGGLTRP